MTGENDKRLSGNVAIVTGGASGIGRATALALAHEGANVVVIDVSQERIDQTLSELAAASTADTGHLGLSLDVRSERDMARMADETLARFGRIDILIACAAVLRGRGSPPKPLVDVTVEEWDQVIDTNLKGVFLSNRAVLPTMIKQRRGNILNMSSTSGREGRAHDGPYCASKFGVIGMSEALAAEVRNYGVRVQLLLPDATDTPMWEQNLPVPMPVEAIPPERVADMIVFLVTLPDDTTIVSPVLMPFRTRKRLGRKEAAAAVSA